MYLDANLSVCILDNLSLGKVGMIFLNAENASFNDCVRCLSLTLARIRWWQSNDDEWHTLFDDDDDGEDDSENDDEEDEIVYLFLFLSTFMMMSETKRA